MNIMFSLSVFPKQMQLTVNGYPTIMFATRSLLTIMSSPIRSSRATLPSPICRLIGTRMLQPNTQRILPSQLTSTVFVFMKKTCLFNHSSHSQYLASNTSPFYFLYLFSEFFSYIIKPSFLCTIFRSLLLQNFVLLHFNLQFSVRFCFRISFPQHLPAIFCSLLLQNFAFPHSPRNFLCAQASEFRVHFPITAIFWSLCFRFSFARLPPQSLVRFSRFSPFK